MRTLALLVALALVAAFALPAPSALADDPAGTASKAATAAEAVPHVRVVAAVVVLTVLGVAGVGCAVAVLGAVFPALAAAVDRQARAAGTWPPLWIGTVVAIGSAFALAGAAKAGGGGALAAALVIGLPALLLWAAGMLAVLPLLGERLLGSGAAGARPASPLKRAVVASVALALAGLPGAFTRFHALNLLFATVSIGWPLGVGLGALFARLRRAPAAPG